MADDIVYSDKGCTVRKIINADNSVYYIAYAPDGTLLGDGASLEDAKKLIFDFFATQKIDDPGSGPGSGGMHP